MPQVVLDGAGGGDDALLAARAAAGVHGGELVLRILLGDGAQHAVADLSRPAALAPLDGPGLETGGPFDARPQPGHSESSVRVPWER